MEVMTMIRSLFGAIPGVDLCGQPGRLLYLSIRLESDLLILKVGPMQPRWQSGILRDWYCISLLDLKLKEFKGVANRGAICFGEGNQEEPINFWVVSLPSWVQFWIEDTTALMIKKFKQANDLKQDGVR
jgi:hypothetical protein